MTGTLADGKQVFSTLKDESFSAGNRTADDVRRGPCAGHPRGRGEFTDDFSADSLQLTIDRRDDGRSTRRYDVLGDRVTMANTGSAEERGRTELGTRGRSDFISARVSMSSESELPEGGRAAGIELSAWLYNTVQDEGAGSVENDGYAQFRIRTDGVQAGASVCLFRARADDSLEGAGLFDGRTCGNFDGFEPELDTEYTLSITVDREAGTVSFAADELTIEASLGQSVFTPFRSRQSVEVVHEAASGQAVGSVHAISTANVSQDFATTPPLIGPYRPIFDAERPGRRIGTVDGRARLETTSTDENAARLGVTAFGDSDTIGATLELSNASTVADRERSEATVSVGAFLYNDSMAGSPNGNEGSVWSSVQIVARTDRMPVIRYCLFRSNDAAFRDVTGLLGDAGELCLPIGDAAFDTEYVASVAIDRDAGAIVWAVDGVERRHIISTPINALGEDQQSLRIGATAIDGATAIAFVDDFPTEIAGALAEGAGDGGTPAAPGVGDAANGAGSVGSGASADAGASSGGGSGGGCSVTSAGGRDPLLFLLAALAVAGSILRRRALRVTS